MRSEHRNTYTNLFSRLGNKPKSISNNDLNIKKRFVVELYIPSAQNISSYPLAFVRLENVVRSLDNDLRKLPPSWKALCKLAKRSCFHSGYLWVDAVEDILLPDASLWDWILNENKDVNCKEELVQLQSTNSRLLAVATRESARHVNVKRLAAFLYVSVKRSVDLNRRQILLVFYRYHLYTIIKVCFLTMAHKNQLALIRHHLTGVIIVWQYTL